MELYTGFDSHANNSYLGIINMEVGYRVHLACQGRLKII